MKPKAIWIAVCALGLALAGSIALYGAGSTRATAGAPQSRLAVVWTSADPAVADRMAFMYAKNAKSQAWFDKVRLIVWGPSAELLATNNNLQKQVKTMMDKGVRVQACVVCARSYNVADDLRDMGIEVKPMGKPLSDLLKDGWKVLTL